MTRPFIYVQRYNMNPAQRPPRDQRLPLTGDGARIAVHFPDLGRCVEMYVGPNGDWQIKEGPSAVTGGEFVEIASGSLSAA